MILTIWVVLAMIVICQAKWFASGFRRARDDFAYRACEAQAVRNSLGKVLPFRRCNCAEGRAKTNFCVISLHLVFDAAFQSAIIVQLRRNLERLNRRGQRLSRSRHQYRRLIIANHQYLLPAKRSESVVKR